MPRAAQVYHSIIHFLARSGFSRLARGLRAGQPCILTFHGLRADDDPGLLDAGLHTPVSVFREICRHLAANYRVMPLSRIVRAVKNGRPLPEGTVAITFDDGYASNHTLASPVLREFGLPATIFATSGFVDRTESLWFHRLEFAVARTALTSLKVSGRTFPLADDEQRQSAYAAQAAGIKALPQEQVAGEMERLEDELGVSLAAAAEPPAIFQPLSWQQARELQEGGLIELGGHTHRHLILGRCAAATARFEIEQSRDRLTAELGITPRLFAYPNGQTGDYTAETAALLQAADFEAAVTMSPGFVRAESDLYALPRYGAPASLGETEATVSGLFETLKQWRLALRPAPVLSR